MPHVVVFAGEYDLANMQGLRREMRRLESSENLVLDLTEVIFIDSTFIAELMLLEKSRRAKNFDRVTVVSPAMSAVRRVFDVCGIAPTLDLVESYDGVHDGASGSIVEFAAAADILDAVVQGKSILHLDRPPSRKWWSDFSRR